MFAYKRATEGAGECTCSYNYPTTYDHIGCIDGVSRDESVDLYQSKGGNI